MKRRVVILMRNPDDGSWRTDGQMFAPKRANELVSLNRVIGGVQSCVFPALEYAKSHPEIELWEE